jgi:adenosylmethionine---8-amino-7-oxononanoate aminotransferase
MFAFQYTNIDPDFICLSKGLTNGNLPFAITLTTDKIYNAFYDDYEKLKTLYHGHTFTANPIACAAANANLDIFEDENICDKNGEFDTKGKMKELSNLLKERLSIIKNNENLKFVGDVRSLGMIGVIELVKDKDTKKPFSFEDRIGYKIYNEALKYNLILRPLGNIIYFFLPLCCSKKDINIIFDKTEKILSKI